MNGIPRVVFDTNIFSSSVGWLGNPLGHYDEIQIVKAADFLKLIRTASKA